VETYYRNHDTHTHTYIQCDIHAHAQLHTIMTVHYSNGNRQNKHLFLVFV